VQTHPAPKTQSGLAPAIMSRKKSQSRGGGMNKTG